jgi:hypothetical protein
VVPAVYALVARNTGSPQDVAHRLEGLRASLTFDKHPEATQATEI